MYMRQPGREFFDGSECIDPDLHSLGHSHHKRARRPALTAHAHTGWECCLIVAGTVEWWVADECWQLGPGAVYLTRPGEPHGAIADTMPPCELWWCQLAERRCGAAWRGLPQRSWHDTTAALPPILELLMDECRQPDAVGSSMVRALIDQLIAAVTRSGMTVNAPANQPPAPLARISERIQGEPNWWPDIQDLCAITGWSRSALFQHARQQWREAPLAWLGRQRIAAARERLISSDASITAIAYDLGYASSQHFATTFRRLCGLTPTAYRQQHMER